jgi:DNA-binding CsgD family transcriptional regulator
VPERPVAEFIATHVRTLAALRALAGVLADDLDVVVQFRRFTAILEDLLEADEVRFWIYHEGSLRQRLESFLLGLGPAVMEHRSASHAGAPVNQFATAAHSLGVPWEASGRILGQIEAYTSRRRGGFDADDDWILRAAGELAGTVLFPKWSGARTASQFGLSRREEIVATLVARGYTNARVASELAISRATVASHIAHILSKLGFRSRAQIAAWVGRFEASESSQQLRSK